MPHPLLRLLFNALNQQTATIPLSHQSTILLTILRATTGKFNDKRSSCVLCVSHTVVDRQRMSCKKHGCKGIRIYSKVLLKHASTRTICMHLHCQRGWPQRSDRVAGHTRSHGVVRPLWHGEVVEMVGQEHVGRALPPNPPSAHDCCRRIRSGVMRVEDEESRVARGIAQAIAQCWRMDQHAQCRQEEGAGSQLCLIPLLSPACPCLAFLP